MNLNLLRAIFFRNFTAFFSSVTGYAFIFFFVLLSVGLSFGLDAIYNTNLANLDVLSSIYPLTMLLLIPAITMGLWAGERRDGTDELLLTMPGSDLDIVLGKYLAAVAIYTTSLLFALVPCYWLLNQLASTGRGLALTPAIDVGLFLATFFGFWLMGLAALGLGMVASFVTRNLTLAWLLGTAMNIPLAALVALTVLMTYVSGLLGHLAPALAELNDSLTAPSRGTLSLLGTVFFVAVVTVALYLCMVLIGARHWGRRDKVVMSLHFALRTLALIVIGASAVVWARRAEVRVDVTAGQLTKLSAETKRLLADLKSDRPVMIEAFISPEVPQEYVQTRKTLDTMIREMTALGHGKVQSRIIPTSEDTDEAVAAETRYGIAPREVVDLGGGTISVKQIFLGVTIQSGLNRVTVPFFDRGIPVEYELIRSIATVLEEKKKKIGVLVTDAPLYGQFDMQSMSAGRNWPVIDELEKQYDVVRVDASGPIDPADYDALLAVQPSTLGPEQMDHFVAAVRTGLPTAIFEDPAPLLAGVTGTSQPRRSPGGMNAMMMGQQSPPKGDIEKLWGLLGVRFTGDSIVWQKWNPFDRIKQFDEQPEFVFIDSGAAKRPFNPDDPITAGMQRLLFPFPGAIAAMNASTLAIKPLVETGEQTGTVRVDDLMEMSPFGQAGGLNPNRQLKFTGASYVLAARIHGEAADDAPPSDGKEKTSKPVPAKINVVLVADLDMLTPAFFALRQQGDNPQLGIHFDFDNVTFILNVLDELAGDNRFIAIRARRPAHRPLARIGEQSKETRDKTAKAIDRSNEQYEQAVAEEQRKLSLQVREIEKKMKAENLDLMEIARRVAIVQQAGEKRLNAKTEQLERERDRAIRKERIKETSKVSDIRVKYKLFAWFLAPIPPLLLGLFVFVRQWMREEPLAQDREKAIHARKK
ncbi:MAG TPA: Gldg family protein [Thermoguttaceae bacterium]|nr:Gldg family protein [Thermoguttaceae bacterium]